MFRKSALSIDRGGTIEWKRNGTGDPLRATGGEAKMNKPTSVIPVVILVNACIWGFTMIMTSKTLSGTGAYDQIQNILGGGAAASLLVVGGGLGGLAKMLKSK
jgi:hypothetical protein